MILYFANRVMQIIGQASTELPEGLKVVDDLLSADTETGVDVFECYVPYDEKTRQDALNCCEVGNYILKQKDSKCSFFTIIQSEEDTRRKEIYLYAEDAGLDLLNETHGAFEADKAYSLEWYVNKYTYDAGFEIGINEAAGLTRKLSWEGEATATERLASVAAQFGGYEISFEFEIEGLTVTRKLINIHKQRGKDVGATLYLNKDIIRIVTSKSIAELATAYECEGGVPAESETPITLAGYKYDDGDFYVSGTRLYSRTAVAKWSRYVWNKEPAQIAGQKGHIVRHYSYDTVTQSTLCANAITALKKAREIEVNYEVDIEKLPAGVEIGDRVNIVDDEGGLYLSTRILRLESSECKNKHSAILGEHLLKKSGISAKVEELAAAFAKNTVSVQRAVQVANAAKALSAEAQLKANAAAGSAEAALASANTAQAAANAAAGSAATATEKADAAEAAVENIKESVKEYEAIVDRAEDAVENAENAATTAAQQARTAKTAAENAFTEASMATIEADRAKNAAKSAESAAAAAQQTAADAIGYAEDATETAAAAKADAKQAERDVAKLGENLSSVQSTMQAYYTRKTEFTETTADLQTQIKQNAAGLSSTASMLLTVDETANNAQAQAEAAAKKAERARQQANEATAAAQAAQDAADDAEQAAQAAQAEADTARAAADLAQSVADKASADLAKAEAELNLLLSSVDATEEEIAVAKAAVTAAKTAFYEAAPAAKTAATAAATAQKTASDAAATAYNARAAADDAVHAADLADKNAKAAGDEAAAAQQAAYDAKQTAIDAQKTAAQAVTDAEEAQRIADDAANVAREAQIAADEAAAKAQRAETNLNAAQRDLADVTARAEATQEEIEAAQAAVDAAQAAATTANTEAEAAQISANTARETAKNAQDQADIAHDAAARAQAAADGALKAASDARSAVDLLAVRTKKCETDISQNAETIKLSATKEEVKETLGGYYTREQADSAIEETAEAISISVKKVTETVDGHDKEIVRAHTLIKSLADQIQMLVVGENGASLMTQTETGWQFNFAGIQELLNKHTDTLAAYDDHIRFTTFEDEPCIELCEESTEFRVLITNTRIMFCQGSQVPCFISNNEFVAENVSVKEELRFGQWVFAASAGGGFGLTWKEVNE